MLDRQITQWQSLAPMMLPNLIGDNNPDEIVRHDDFVVMTYRLEHPFPMTDVVGQFVYGMDYMILYLATPKNSESGEVTDFCCFAQPASLDMIKVNVKAGEDGIVKYFSVSIYSSLEMLVTDLDEELAEQEAVSILTENLSSEDIYSIFA